MNKKDILWGSALILVGGPNIKINWNINSEYIF